MEKSKYGQIIMLIESYNGAMESNRDYYCKEINRHPADFVKIGAESSYEEKEIIDSRLSALEKEFPNIEFSINDVELLSKIYNKKQKNSSEINKAKLNIEWYGYRSAVSNGDIKRMNDAEEKQPELENKYTNAYTSFFEVCEKLSNPEVLENPEFDFESEIFSKIYEQGFCLRPQNPILKKYYETYKTARNKEKENKNLSKKNSTLSEQVEQLNQENTELKNDNNELKQKNSKLQSMLAKTLQFCDYVRESKFGKFFFRKKIKELPEPQSIEEER